jgi:hypothetical protein
LWDAVLFGAPNPAAECLREVRLGGDPAAKRLFGERDLGSRLRRRTDRVQALELGERLLVAELAAELDPVMSQLPLRLIEQVMPRWERAFR